MDKYWKPRVLDIRYGRGLVESYFIKLNEPSGRWAAWLKYTFLIRKGRFDPLGECWFILFDREAKKGRQVWGGKETFDLQGCGFGGENTEISIGDNLLTPGLCIGELKNPSVFWNLSFGSVEKPFMLLPGALYSPLAPTTKLTTPFARASATGTIQLPGRLLRFTEIPMSLGHNWGRKHSDSYVWGQARLAGAQGDLFFEGSSLPAKVPRDSKSAVPLLTVGKVRHGDEDISFAGPQSWLANSARLSMGRWDFELRNANWLLRGEFTWDPRLVAGLRYLQPDGGIRSCLNSMTSAARLELLRRRGASHTDRVAVAHQDHSAALEFLVPDLDHGFPMLA